MKSADSRGPNDGSYRIEIAQIQGGPPFRVPLEIAIVSTRGQPRIAQVELTESTGRFTFEADAEPASVTLDPNTWVLMQVAEFVRR